MTTARTTLGYLSAAHIGITIAVEHADSVTAGPLVTVEHSEPVKGRPQTWVVVSEGERRVGVLLPSSTPCDLASDKAVAS